MSQFKASKVEAVVAKILKPSKPLDTMSGRPCGLCSKLPCDCPNLKLEKLENLSAMVSRLVASGEMSAMDAPKWTKMINGLIARRKARISAVMSKSAFSTKLVKDKCRR